MSQQQNTGEKTEKPTRKKLRDARREGQVPKSRDLTQTVVTIAWVVVLGGLGGWMAGRLAHLTDVMLGSIDDHAAHSTAQVSAAAVEVLVWITLVPLALIAAVGTLCEFLQAGPVLAPKRIAPKPSNIGVTQGLKRIFSIDNVFETLKAIVKTLIIVLVVTVIALQGLDVMLAMPRGDVRTVLDAGSRNVISLFIWVSVLFAFVSFADWLYQRYSFEKKQRMSKHDVKREHKEQDGDPQTRGARRSLHREWATQSVSSAARKANVVVVNPTHVAVAIHYRASEHLVPVVSARGSGAIAQLIREQAALANVPIVRNVDVARALFRRCETDDFVPEDLFDAVAEIIAWAEEMSRHDEPT